MVDLKQGKEQEKLTHSLTPFLLVSCLLLTFFLAGCTSNSNTIVLKDLEKPHLYGIADTPQTMNVVGQWQAIDFNFDLGDNYGFGIQDSNCIVVTRTAHYIADIEAHFIDSAPNPKSVVALRVSLNGEEVSGSYSEISMFKQDAEQLITTFTYVEAKEDDVVCMEWLSSDATVTLDMDNTYASQPIVAKGFINWVHD
jgi:hypothetical protein